MRHGTGEGLLFDWALIENLDNQFSAPDIGALRREARELLEKARAQQANRGGQEVILDEELTEHLKALGYIN